MDWIPAIDEWQGPIYLRIVDALSADIHSRRLVRGLAQACRQHQPKAIYLIPTQPPSARFGEFLRWLRQRPANDGLFKRAESRQRRKSNRHLPKLVRILWPTIEEFPFSRVSFQRRKNKTTAWSPRSGPGMHKAFSNKFASGYFEPLIKSHRREWSLSRHSSPTCPSSFLVI